MSGMQQFIVVVLLLPCSLFSLLHSSSQKTRLVIDTDGVTDDIRAITIAVKHPEAQVVAITTVNGCASATQALRNVKRTLRANERQGIPVFVGAAAPLLPQRDATIEEEMASFFGVDRMGDREDAWPKPDPSDKDAEPIHAALKLIELFKADRSLTLVCLGPLTNIALALHIHPAFAEYPRRVIIMGGNMYGRGNVGVESSAEWNFHIDPEAAAVVLSEMRSPVTILPLETMSFNVEKYGKQANVTTHLMKSARIAQFLSSVTEHVRSRVRQLQTADYWYIDEIAVSIAIDPHNVIVSSETHTVDVELSGHFTRGQLYVTPWLDEARPNRTIVTEIDNAVVDMYMNHAVDTS